MKGAIEMTEDFEDKLVEFIVEGNKAIANLPISTEIGYKDSLRKWMKRAREVAEELKPDSFSVQVSTTPPNVAVQLSFDMK